jgi:hypothetical protein
MVKNFGWIAGGTAAALLLGSVASVDAQRARRDRRDDRRDQAIEAATDWNRLGERVVNAGGRTDRDAIVVTAAEGRFTRIQLRVEHSALELFDVVVTFADGTTFSPATRLVFAQGTNSRVIDLPGGARAIRRVDFRYANLAGGGRAQIELWAR